MATHNKVKGVGRPKKFGPVLTYCVRKLVKDLNLRPEAVAVGFGVGYQTVRDVVNGPQPSMEELLEEIRADFRKETSP